MTEEPKAVSRQTSATELPICRLFTRSDSREYFAAVRRGIGAKPAVSRRPSRQQNVRICRVFSTGATARTRDLRRDRPVRGSRRLTTIDAESLYPWAFPGLSRNPFRMVERSRFQTFAARLLPEPAGRAGLCGGPGKTTEGRRSSPQSLHESSTCRPAITTPSGGSATLSAGRCPPAGRGEPNTPPPMNAETIHGGAGAHGCAVSAPSLRRSSLGRHAAGRPGDC
jgi:hypothetical protein